MSIRVAFFCFAGAVYDSLNILAGGSEIAVTWTDWGVSLGTIVIAFVFAVFVQLRGWQGCRDKGLMEVTYLPYTRKLEQAGCCVRVS